jgi:hypothetical protein
MISGNEPKPYGLVKSRRRYLSYIRGGKGVFADKVITIQHPDGFLKKYY